MKTIFIVRSSQKDIKAVVFDKAQTAEAFAKRVGDSATIEKVSVMTETDLESLYKYLGL